MDNTGFSFKTDGPYTNLVYTLSEGENVSRFEDGMIANNNIKGVLGYSYMQEKGRISLSYNIIHGTRFSFLRRGKLNRTVVLSIFKNITDILLSAEEYMLDESHFVFDDDCIFVDTAGFAVDMVYLPVENCKGKKFVDFLKEFVINGVYEDIDDPYPMKILNFVNTNPGASAEELKQFFTSMLNNQSNSPGPAPQNGVPQGPPGRGTVFPAPMPQGPPPNSFAPQDQLPQPPPHGGIPQDISQKGGAPQKPETPQNIISPKIMPQGGQPGFPPHNAMGNIPPVNNGGKEIKMSPPPQQPPAAQPAAKGKKGPLLSGLFGGKTKESMPEQNVFGNMAVPGMDKPVMNNPANQAPITPPISNRPVPPVQPQPAQKQPNPGMKPKLVGQPLPTQFTPQGADIDVEEVEQGSKTIRLRKGASGTPSGVSQQSGWLIGANGKERVMITHNNFTVGKELKGNIPNDYVIDNPSVSRNHAMFTIKDSKYYITDLASLNGSFVNGQQIPGNVEIELRPGDTIELSNQKYTFKIE